MSGYQAEAYLPPTRARLYREAGATSLKHAIIVTGGKQYRVAEGDVIFVEKLDVEAGETVKFDRVLAVIDEDKAVFGTPVVENAVVSGNVVKNGKSKKAIAEHRATDSPTPRSRSRRSRPDFRN